MVKATARKLDLQQRQELFDALNKWITKQGAWITSAPGSKRLKIECRQGSPLPTRLAELGYSPRYAGTATRIEAGKFLPVDILEVSIG